MNEREHAVQRLRWSLDRLAYLHHLGALAPPAEIACAWREHLAACRHLTRLNDGARR